MRIHSPKTRILTGLVAMAALFAIITALTRQAPPRMSYPIIATPPEPPFTPSPNPPTLAPKSDAQIAAILAPITRAPDEILILPVDLRVDGELCTIVFAIGAANPEQARAVAVQVSQFVEWSNSPLLSLTPANAAPFELKQPRTSPGTDPYADRGCILLPAPETRALPSNGATVWNLCFPRERTTPAISAVDYTIRLNLSSVSQYFYTPDVTPGSTHPRYRVVDTPPIPATRLK